MNDGELGRERAVNEEAAMKMLGAEYESINSNKANFDRIYRMPDPREYFRVLYDLDYVIPELSKTIFRSLIANCRIRRRKRPKVLDIGCSYGVNAALVRFPLDIERLAARYGTPEMLTLSPSRLAELDRNYFESWPQLVDADFVGVDCSYPAVAYAQDVGLIDAGVTSDLERQSPQEAETETLRGLDLIISTGCVGYITEKSFARILALQDRGRMPWIASFVLRMFPYHSLAEELRKFGLVTEKLEGVTFVQRRFHSKLECETTIETLKAQGIDPAGKETEGLYHAEFYLSRPESDIECLPLSDVISITSGASRIYGSRYRQLKNDVVTLIP